MPFQSKIPLKLPARQKGFTLMEILLVLGILGTILAVASLIYSGYRIKASETVAQEDLRQAYTSAMTFFIDFPQRTLTRADLEKYGFQASPRVETRIVDGRLASLLLVSYSTLPDSKVFMIQGLGTGFIGGKDSSGPIIGPGGSGGGTSLSGPSGGIPGDSFAGPSIQPINETGRDRCNEKAKGELKEAFDFAQKYFAKDPGGSITKDILMEDGYRPSEEVNLLVINGARPSLELSAIFSVPGALNFRIDSSGSIREG
jgi:prepilin-type N-terminal cleavage/methylation domain-containing protein